MTQWVILVNMHVYVKNLSKRIPVQKNWFFIGNTWKSYFDYVSMMRHCDAFALKIQFALYVKISVGLRMELRHLMTADSFIIQFMLAQTFLITHYTQGNRIFVLWLKYLGITGNMTQEVKVISLLPLVWNLQILWVWD